MKPPNFAIKVGPQGTFQPSGGYQTTPEDIDALFETWRSNHITQITLYFHGGLVPEEAGLNAARRLHGLFENDEAFVAFVWETGLRETIAENITQIKAARVFNKILYTLLKRLSPYFISDLPGARSAGGEFTDTEIDLQLAQTAPFEQYNWPAAGQGGRGAGAPVLTPETLSEDWIMTGIMPLLMGDTEFQDLIPSVPDDLEEEGNRGVGLVYFARRLARAMFKVLHRHIAKRDHGFYPTVIEEILREFYIAQAGAWIWQAMKIKAGNMWADNAELQGNRHTVGGYFLEQLNDYKKEFPDTKINLIGHSAGSIAICRLFETTTARYPQLVFHSVVFLAPACTANLFHTNVVTRPQQFSYFRCFTMCDHAEQKDILVPYVYPRSLLYLVSGILEEMGRQPDVPIVGMERFFTPTTPFADDHILQEIKSFLQAADQQRLILSPTLEAASEGLRCSAISHGDFDDDARTLESTLYFIRNSGR